MFSSQFLAYYAFFTAAVSAYRGTPEDARSAPEEKTVAYAFSKATAGMPKKDQTALLLFVLRLIQQPEQFEKNKHHRDSIEWALDLEVAKQFPGEIFDNFFLIEANFLRQTGMTKEILSQKARERRIFSIPQWAHKEQGEEYYPAFFVDPQYDTSLLETVSMTLRASNGARKYRFFTTPDPTLADKTPLEVLASGELESVVAAAKAFRKRTVIKLDDI